MSDVTEPRQVSIGDRVRILVGDRYTGPNQYFVGKEGTVVRASPSPYSIIVRLDDGKEYGCSEDELEIVAAE